MPSSNTKYAVILLKKGNSEGFKTLFHLYNKQLFFLAKKYVKDSHLAEDAIQDVFIQLWLKRETLDPERCIKSFLFTCLRNHLLNMIRNQKRRIIAAYQIEERYHPTTNCTSDDIQYREYSSILAKGIEDMPEKRQEIFRLKIHENLSNEQVADRLQISVNTVKVQYRKGRKFIKAHLQHEAGISFQS